MRIVLATVKFNGAGHVDCRKCSHRTVFPEGAWLMVFDYGATQIIRSVHSLAILHRCGQEHFWQCEGCGDIPDQRVETWLARRPRGRVKWKPLCVCGGEYKQHRVQRVPEVQDDVRVPISPF